MTEDSTPLIKLNYKKEYDTETRCVSDDMREKDRINIY